MDDRKNPEVVGSGTDAGRDGVNPTEDAPLGGGPAGNVIPAKQPPDSASYAARLASLSADPKSKPETRDRHVALLQCELLLTVLRKVEALEVASLNR